MDLLLNRFERMYALGPEISVLASGTALSNSRFADKKALCEKLSPPSSARVRALGHPTKASLADYDKTMNSSESSVKKALSALEKLVIKMKSEEEERAAHTARLEQLRSKKLQMVASAMDVARQKGYDAAEEQQAAQGDSDSESAASSSSSSSSSKCSKDANEKPEILGDKGGVAMYSGEGAGVTIDGLPIVFEVGPTEDDSRDDSAWWKLHVACEIDEAIDWWQNNQKCAKQKILSDENETIFFQAMDSKTMDFMDDLEWGGVTIHKTFGTQFRGTMMSVCACVLYV